MNANEKKKNNIQNTQQKSKKKKKKKELECIWSVPYLTLRFVSRIKRNRS